MSLPRYGEYKDSGAEWLGEVPAHWDVLRIKHLVVSIEQGWSPQCEGFPVQSDDEWGVLKVGCVNGGVFRPEENKKLPPELDPLPELGLASGDVLISRANTRELVGSAAVVCRDYSTLMLCDKLYRLRLSPDACTPVFLALYLSIRRVRGQIELAATGASSSMLNIGQSTILELNIALPPVEEQTAIATFLDRETGKIDALIAEQEELLRLLAEKRQATISHAVTKGLNPDAPMKDSGVEWLGQVPGHWEVGNLKRFAEVIDCKHHTVEFLDDGLPIVSIRELRDNRIDLSNAKLTSPKEWDFLREGRIPQHGDLIFCRNASVGAVGYVSGEQVPFCMGQDVCLIRPQTKSRFMHFQATCRTVANQIEAFLVGATIRRANVEEIRNLLVTWPPAVEQEEIAAFLDAETARLDALTAEATRAINLLKERRTALISAAVTGKIDVRHEVA